MKKLHQTSYTALNRNHTSMLLKLTFLMALIVTSMLLKLTFLMALIVTLQIDLNYSYRYCKSFNINPKSSSQVKRSKAPVLIILCDFS